MKVFVTGGTGNIGQYVTKALLEAGHTVVLLTRTPDRIPAYQAMEGVTVVKGNILELDVLERAMQGCDGVVHIALGWGNDPVEMLDHDTRVTAFLMDAAEKAGVKNFVYTSSTAAMGAFYDGINEDCVLRPTDLYGATKAATEMFLLGFNQYYTGQGVYGKKTSLRRNIIRPGYTFSNPAFAGGASQSDTRFKQIAEAVLKNEPVTVNVNDGTAFLSGGQIAQLYVKLLESGLDKEVFLAMGTQFVTWGDIARAAKELVPESTSQIIETGERKAPDHCDVSKMERVFGLKFRGDEELRDHIAWNIERARKELNGEPVHNVYHVW